MEELETKIYQEDRRAEQHIPTVVRILYVEKKSLYVRGCCATNKSWKMGEEEEAERGKEVAMRKRDGCENVDEIKSLEATNSCNQQPLYLQENNDNIVERSRYKKGKKKNFFLACCHRLMVRSHGLSSKFLPSTLPCVHCFKV